MKKLNTRIFPKLSDGCNFCCVIYTNPLFAEPFGALPEMIGFEVFPEDSGPIRESVRPERIYNCSQAAHIGSGMRYRSSKLGISQKEAAEILSRFSPLVVRDDLELALVSSLFSKYEIKQKIAVTAFSVAYLAGIEKHLPVFENAVQMKRFFSEVALTYF